MKRINVRALPGTALALVAIVLYSRAGYGPFGDPKQCGQACTLTRCPHNATIMLAAAGALLWHAAQPREPAPQASTVA